jgi:hypothetical protein
MATRRGCTSSKWYNGSTGYASTNSHRKYGTQISANTKNR